ncbi:MAG: exodeoxyribonuclease VII large subunit, partial [Saccharopolyspora rectivirgula]
EEVGQLRDRARRAMTTALTAEQHALTATRSRLTALGPAATLARGYAIVQRVDDGADGVLRSVADAPAGARLRVRVADGAFHAVVAEKG